MMRLSTRVWLAGAVVLAISAPPSGAALRGPVTSAVGERVRTVDAGTVTLRWRAWPRRVRIRSYRVQVGTRRARGRPVYASSRVMRRRTVRLRVRAGTTYYVRVLATDRAGRRERDRRADFIVRVRARGAPGGAGVHATGLEAEGSARLLGTDARRPRLSWRMTAQRHGVRQSAFEVRVALSPALLERGGDVWESGRVGTDRPWVDYGGSKLRSRTRYHWTVRVWDERGMPTPWAQPAWFETALLEESDWQARWIAGAAATVTGPGEHCSFVTAPGQREDPICTPPSPILRHEFTVARPVERARLYASGLGYGVYRINDTRVGDRELSPAFTDYTRRVAYTTEDVTDLVRRGRNAIGVELGRGYYAITHDDNQPNHSYHRAPWHDEPKARVQLELTYTDGTSAVVASGPEWRAAAGPTIYDNLFGGETYDGARAGQLGAWTEPGYDDRAWQAASPAAAPAGALQAQSVEPERIVERRRFRSVRQVAPGVHVFDLGQHVSGWTEIRVAGPPGGQVELLHGESLNADGTVVRPSGIAVQTDVYRLAGSGRVETYRPQFAYHGFQWVQVTGWPGGGPTLDDLTAHVVTADLRPAGEFSASDPLLERIVRNTRAAVIENAHAMPTDTPVFEKTGWTGDGQIMAPSWMYLFDSRRLLAKWSADMEDAQADAGYLPLFAPSPVSVAESAEHAFGWDVALFGVPWDLYRHYGDARALATRYDAMARYIAYIRRYTQADGLWPPPGGTLVSGDWNTVQGAPKGAWADANAWWYRMHRIAADAAALLRRGAEAAAYEGEAARIRDSYNRTFLDTAAGIYRDPQSGDGYSQHVNAMALELGLVPDGLRRRVADQLAADVAARGHHLNTGMVGTRFLWPALGRNGHVQEALAAAAQRTYPSYGYWIDTLGLTSLGESWQNMRSRSHHYLGTVVQWFFEGLAGITPVEPGFAEIEFRPQVPASGLDWVRASTDTVRGEVESSWRRIAGGLELRVVVPPNARARVHVPAASRGAVRAPAEAEFLHEEPGRAVYALGSGDHTFVSSTGAASRIVG